MDAEIIYDEVPKKALPMTSGEKVALPGNANDDNSTDSGSKNQPAAPVVE